MKNNKKIGLSLSGGGYRATIYHLGTLRKLRELNVLDAVDVISTNSGGSITGATYGIHLDDFDTFEKVIRKGVKRSVIKGVFTSWRFLLVFLFLLIWVGNIVYLLSQGHAWRSFGLLFTLIAILLYFQFKLFPISKLNERMYNKFFFGGKSLSALSSKVRFAINATNLETGRLFTFSNTTMGDSVYSYPEDEEKSEPVYFKAKHFPIARAVAASTSVPFVFTPINIGKEYFKDPNDYNRIKPRLVDGGVYDNQGAHKITQIKSAYGTQVVIISDAGNIMPFKNTYKNTLTLLIRTSNVFMNRIKNLQMVQYLYENHKTYKREIAYQSLGWDIEDSIPKFIEGIKDGIIQSEVLKYHNITNHDIINKKWDLIETKLKTNIGYSTIVENANTKEQLAIARRVKTGLSPLKDEQINALINHASVLTELQVKLYCPSLFN
ncbi:patatin-like phospholipase family protein [uncultured Lacinutrix sp.]|uniref:patatin-like phospholipase family protein n=1 Tax=uncultured Lacinutrix sp. TaxID=574032 RepID=UPI002605EDAF|nr:patatin-like phospholipase family protein [uncultured Lacinutrix sp.]